MLLGITAGLLVTGGTGYFIGRSEEATRLDKTLRRVLWAVAGSLLAYNYYALNLPGAALLASLNGWAGFVTTILGGGAGLAIYRWVSR